MLTVLALASALFAQDTVTRHGNAVPAGDAVSVTTVRARSADFVKRPVIVEGVVVRNCTDRGCWMQVAPAADAEGVRVTFRDYGFFIPVNSAGKRVRMVGVAERLTIPPAAVDARKGEGATLLTESDGSVTELTFIATGVELHPAKP